MIKADSVYANELCDVKKPSTSEHPCAICMVSRSELGNPDVLELRTTSQITRALQEITNASSVSEKAVIAKRTGVVLRGDQPNPYRQFASVDTVRQIPPDVFHQDSLVRAYVGMVLGRAWLQRGTFVMGPHFRPSSFFDVISSLSLYAPTRPRCFQNTKSKLFHWLMKALTKEGKRIVPSKLRDEEMYPAREEKLRDITVQSGLTSMTGMEIWRLSGIMLPVFRMCLVSEDALVSDFFQVPSPRWNIGRESFAFNHRWPMLNALDAREGFAPVCGPSRARPWRVR